MGTRQDLEREREALRDLLAWGIPRGHITHPEQSALTASIARLDALLSLSDEDVRSTVEIIDQTLVGYAAHGAADFGTRVLPVVADLVRRTS